MSRTLGVSLVLACAPVVVAQQTPFEEVALRVASLRPNGQCVVDRGERDLVEVEDRVVLMPRNAPSVTGRVVQVEGRTALVQLLDPKANVPVGTRGHVLVPKARLQPVGPEPEPEPKPVVGEAGDDEPKADDEWQPGMPLLGRHRPPQPQERDSQVRGRLYGSANLVRTLDSFSQSFLTTGAAVDVNNIDGDGGVLRFHGDFNRSEEFSGVIGNDLRVYELSYEQGGTRFRPWRWQVGRFLQRDMPEFGILDGIEVGYRGEGGDRFGASFGYLPELDDDMESLSDLQIALWYVWNQDVGERVTYGIGYQKTWHRFDGDRDLFVLKARYLPENGWDVSSTIFIDVYNSNDVLKNETLEVTRANLFAARRTRGVGGVEFFFDHEEYPELLRQENQQTILPTTLIDAHNDRLSAHGWTENDAGTRWFGRVVGWIDEERAGGSAELGVEVQDLFGERSRTALVAFGTQAPSSALTGVRVEYGGTFSYGRLDALYELGFAHFEGFADDRDDLLQHRIGGTLATDLGGGWDATFLADTTFYDSELSFGVGIYLQRLF